MADGWQHKREVRGGVGDWRLREEESGSWGDEDLTVECGGDVGFPSWVVIGPKFSNFHGLLYRFVTVR
jgi:hypothetical protein